MVQNLNFYVTSYLCVEFEKKFLVTLNTRSTETTKHLELLPLPEEQSTKTRLSYTILSIKI